MSDAFHLGYVQTKERPSSIFALPLSMANKWTFTALSQWCLDPLSPDSNTQEAVCLFLEGSMGSQERLSVIAVPGYDPQPMEVKHNVDVGARVPPVDAAKLLPVQLPADYMPMLTPLQGPVSGAAPYVEAEFGELTAVETASLVSK